MSLNPRVLVLDRNPFRPNRVDNQNEWMLDYLSLHDS